MIHLEDFLIIWSHTYQFDNLEKSRQGSQVLQMKMEIRPVQFIRPETAVSQLFWTEKHRRAHVNMRTDVTAELEHNAPPGCQDFTEQHSVRHCEVLSTVALGY